MNNLITNSDNMTWQTLAVIVVIVVAIFGAAIYRAVTYKVK